MQLWIISDTQFKKVAFLAINSYHAPCFYKSTCYHPLLTTCQHQMQHSQKSSQMRKLNFVLQSPMQHHLKLLEAKKKHFNTYLSKI